MTPQEINSVHSRIDELVATSEELKLAFNIKTRVFAWMVGVAVLVLAVLVVLTSITLVNSFRNGQVARRAGIIAKDAKDTVEIVRNATGPEAQARNVATVKKLVEEGDCRNRRARAGLPAPNLDSSCASQTPASVYPGA